MIKSICGFFILCLVSSANAQDVRPFSFADLSEKLLPAVVNISTIGNNDVFSSETEYENNGNVSLGSGFLIDDTGYIITNNHVIAGAEKILVTTNDDKTYDAKIKGIDTKTDLALIKIEDNKQFPYVSLGNSDNIRIGDWILAIGNPFGLGGSVTVGIVSAKSRDIESGAYDNFIQTDASINQGNSGGPMFDMNGDVIGINTAIYSTSGGNMGIGFALPVNLAKFVIEQLKIKGKVERSWLGIKVQSLTNDIAKSRGLQKLKGVLVSDVSEKSPAAQAGIEAGDILLGFNDKPILQTRNFSQAVAETMPNTEVNIELWRDKKIINVKTKTKLMPMDIKEDNYPKKRFTADKSGMFIDELGISIADLSPDIRDKYNIANSVMGVIVLDVNQKTDAAIKGIRKGDVISQIDKFNVISVKDVQNLIMVAKKENNRPVLLTINNNGIDNFAAVKLKDKN